MSKKSTKANKMIVANTPVNEFDISYESLGIEHFLKESSNKDFNNIKSKLNNTEDSFWNSEIFMFNKQEYNKKLNELQTEAQIISAGICSFCGSDKTTTTSKQTCSSDEGFTFFKFCITCQRTKRM